MGTTGEAKAIQINSLPRACKLGANKLEPNVPLMFQVVINGFVRGRSSVAGKRDGYVAASQ